MADKLTAKQEAFVSFYIGEANYNATKAAKLAGYSVPRQSGAECLSNPVIAAEIKAHLDSLKTDGIRIKEVRVNKLVQLDDALEQIQRERAEAAREQGIDVPGVSTGLVVETIKVGPRGNVSEFVIDKALLAERRALMEQVSKELGESLSINLTLENHETARNARDKLLEKLEGEAPPDESVGDEDG